jgi:hypothetical protein
MVYHQVESEARMQHVRFPVPPIVIDWIMRKTTKCTSSSNTGIRWNITSKLEDLDYADDIALLSSTKDQMQRKSNLLNTYSMQNQLV